MSTTPIAPVPGGYPALNDAIAILQSVALLSPIATALVMQIIKGLGEGKTLEEVLANEDAGWQDIRSKAEKEIEEARKLSHL